MIFCLGFTRDACVYFTCREYQHACMVSLMKVALQRVLCVVQSNLKDWSIWWFRKHPRYAKLGILIQTCHMQREIVYFRSYGHQYDILRWMVSFGCYVKAMTIIFRAITYCMLQQTLTICMEFGSFFNIGTWYFRAL
jgi:hypothetical protein